MERIMKTILLKNLELENFKGITGKWEFNPGKNVFLGRNGTGKTTLVDAEHWIRTGKNSLGLGQFDIKTIDAKGKALHGINHTVIAVYDVNGEELTLERSYVEKWTKSRGKSQKEFTGHTTTYRLNNQAKTSKREFDAKVVETFGDDEFRIVSTPGYFAKLPWEYRREFLFEISEMVDTDKVMDNVEGLREALGENSIVEKSATIKERRKQINDDLKTLPARIDELQNRFVEINKTINLEEAEKEQQIALDTLDVIKGKIAEAERGANPEHDQKLKEFNAELRRLRAMFEKEKGEVHQAEQKRWAKISLLEFDQNNLQDEINKIDLKITRLKDQYEEIFKEKFAPENITCKICGEVISCSNCDETPGEEEGIFNLQKADKLKEINNKGKAAVAKKKELSEKIVQLELEIKTLKEVPEPAILALKTTPDIQKLVEKIEKLTEEIDDLKGAEIPESLIEDRENAEVALRDCQEIVAQVKVTAGIKERIATLESKKADISKEFDQLEKIAFLIDQYNKLLAEQTEMAVNKLFEDVSFRMFTAQVNGNIVPVCDIMNKSNRPYETALSRGECLKADLDIIKTFSKFWNIYAPVFIDNAEALTDIPELDCQTIELRVSPQHKTLTQL